MHDRQPLTRAPKSLPRLVGENGYGACAGAVACVLPRVVMGPILRGPVRRSRPGAHPRRPSENGRWSRRPEVLGPEARGGPRSRGGGSGARAWVCATRGPSPWRWEPISSRQQPSSHGSGRQRLQQRTEVQRRQQHSHGNSMGCSVRAMVPPTIIRPTELHGTGLGRQKRGSRRDVAGQPAKCGTEERWEARPGRSGRIQAGKPSRHGQRPESPHRSSRRATAGSNADRLQGRLNGARLKHSIPMQHRGCRQSNHWGGGYGGGCRISSNSDQCRRGTRRTVQYQRSSASRCGGTTGSRSALFPSSHCCTSPSIVAEEAPS